MREILPGTLREILGEIATGFRMVRRDRGFWGLVIMTMALGIGVLTAVFSVVDAVLLEPLPYRQPERLVSLVAFHPEHGENLVSRVDTFETFARQARQVELAAVVKGRLQMTTPAGPRQLEAALGSPGFLELFGTTAALGHLPGVGDGVAGGSRPVVLSRRLWQGAFGGDPGVLGQGFRFVGDLPDGSSGENQLLTVVGVLGREFRAPFANLDPDLWLAADFGSGTPATTRVVVFGRLLGEATVETAQGEMATLFDRLQEERGEAAPWRLQVMSLNEFFARDFRRPLLLLLCGGLLVLLVATANCANLMMARARLRLDEIALRSSLGASRWRLVRLLLLEGLVPSAVAGGMGVGVAWLALVVYRHFDLLGLPRRYEVTIDGRVLVFVVVASLGSHLLLTLIPTLRLSRFSLASDIGSRTRTLGNLGFGGSRYLLLAVQVSMALVIAACSLLLVSSLGHLRQVSPGFVADNLFTARLALPSSSYPQGVDKSLLYQRLLAAIERQPGVEGAAMVSYLPLGGSSGAMPFAVESRQAGLHDEDPLVQFRGVSPGYLETMGIPRVAGRSFVEDDLRRQPMIVSASAARLLWGEREALGQRLKMGGASSRNPWSEVVGVVEDVKHDSLRLAGEPTVYLPFLYDSQMAMVVRAASAGRAKELLTTVSAELSTIDPGLPVFDSRTMEQRIDSNIAKERLVALLMSWLTFLTIALAAVGIYGAIWHTVVERRQEVGLRIALGASKLDVWGMFLRRAVPWVGGGMAAGMIVALLVSGGLRSLLFEVDPRDLGVHGVASLGVTVIALLATYLPTARASRTPPAEILRGSCPPAG